MTSGGGQGWLRGCTTGGGVEHDVSHTPMTADRHVHPTSTKERVTLMKRGYAGTTTVWCTAVNDELTGLLGFADLIRSSMPEALCRRREPRAGGATSAAIGLWCDSTRTDQERC